MTRALIILFVILYPIFQFGQVEYSSRVIDISNGLPTNTIYDIKQVSDGSILIGHEKGLSRFNGVSFIHYECDKIVSLSNIVELKKGKYLCRSFNDDCYVTEGNKLERKDNLSIKDYFFSTYHKYADESVIKVRGKYIEKIWDGHKFVIENFCKIENDTSRINYLAINQDKLLCELSNSLALVDVKNVNNVQYYNIESGQKTICHYFNGDFFILGSVIGKAWRINEKDQIKLIDLEEYNPKDKFACITTIQDTILAIGTFGGLYLYDTNYKLISKTLKGSLITAVTEDIEGNIWVGTQAEGLKIIPSLKIKTWQEEFFAKNRFSISNSLTISDSLVVVGSYDGRLAFFSNDGDLIKIIELEGKSEVQALYFDQERNSLFVDCLHLFEFNMDNYQIRTDCQSRSIKDLFIKDDIFYMATSVGLHVGESASNYKVFNENVWCKHLVPFKEGFLVESIEGLYYFEHNYLSSLNGNFIGRNDNKIIGVSGLNKSSGRTTFAVGGEVYEIENDKPKLLFEIENFKIKATVASKFSVWVSDGSKIYRFNTDGLKLIDKYNGLVISDIINLEVLNGKLLVIGTQKIQLLEGLKQFSGIKPEVSVLTINGSYSISKNKYYSEFEENLFIAHLEILPNIASLGTNKIFYRIKDVVPQWTELINSTLVLERLPFGEYVVEIKGVNENEIISEIMKISLVVYPPFYSTWWFRSAVLLSVFLVLFLIVKWRIRIIENKNARLILNSQLESNVIQAELKALRSQMNPHFIFNSLSSIQSRILNGEPKLAYEHLSTFSTLLRQSLKYTGKEFITINEELAFLRNYISLEQSRLSDRFDYEVSLSSEIDGDKVQFPSLLSQPFAENAIRHGLKHSEGSKNLLITVEGSNEQFTFTIEDNGIGRERSKKLNMHSRTEHESFALGAIMERISMINKDEKMALNLDILDLDTGTKVIISIINKK